MKADQNHYEVLGVSENASTSEIENAFYRKVRDHPPERDPKGHERLQEARRILLDEALREEYDAMRRSGGKVEELKEEAKQAINRGDPDYKAAIKKLKEAVVLAPELEILRNRLGQVYFQNDQPQKALEQFDRALELSKDPPAGYFASRGQALDELGKLRESEQALRKAWRRDQGNYEIARILSQVFHRQDKVEEALEVLDRAIWADDKLNFEDFFCYHAKLQIYVAEGEIGMLDEELKTVKELPETKQDREYAAFMLDQTGQMLLEGKAYRMARKFIDAAVRLDPVNPEMKARQRVARKRAELKKSLEEISSLPGIHDFVKYIVGVFYESCVGAASSEEIDQKKEEIKSALQNMMEVDPENSEIKESVRRIRKKFPNIFQMDEEAFKAILSMPDASNRIDDCPHCSNPVQFEKGASATGTCGGCGEPIKIENGEVKKGVSISLPNSSEGNLSEEETSGDQTSKEKSTEHESPTRKGSSSNSSPASSDDVQMSENGQQTGYGRRTVKDRAVDSEGRKSSSKENRNASSLGRNSGQKSSGSSSFLYTYRFWFWSAVVVGFIIPPHTFGFAVLVVGLLASPFLMD